MKITIGPPDICTEIASWLFGGALVIGGVAACTSATKSALDPVWEAMDARADREWLEYERQVRLNNAMGKTVQAVRPTLPKTNAYMIKELTEAYPQQELQPAPIPASTLSPDQMAYLRDLVTITVAVLKVLPGDANHVRNIMAVVEIALQEKQLKLT